MMAAELLQQIEALVRQYYASNPRQGSHQANRVSLSAPAYDACEAIRCIRTILSGWISQGPNVREFEHRFAQYIGVASGIAVNSGSSANLAALLALKERYGLKEGDEVIVPASTFATVAMPVIQAGLVPVYVDVDRRTLNIDPQAIEAGLSERTRVLMIVHTLGFPAGMDQIGAIAKRRGLLVFEDCCEAHGASIRGRKVGSFGEIATFSFFIAHNLTTGEGGMIITGDPGLEEICRSLREFGRADQAAVHTERYYSDERLGEYDRRYVFSRLGFNFRMTDVAAAFGIEQLIKLDALNAKRQDHAAQLKTTLASRIGAWMTLPPEEEGVVHSYYAFSMVLPEAFRCSRRRFCEHLEAHGIETRPLFAGCLPDQPAFRRAPGRLVGTLPNARFLRDRAVFVGIHPGLTHEQIQHMADTIATFVARETIVHPTATS